jgi:acyl-CoA reductase-like NAD-dependent aldehyde dehydrogenase
MNLIVSSLIEGSSVASSSEETFDLVNPSTGEIGGRHPVGVAQDVDHAVASARRALDDRAWWDTNPAHKKKVLHRLADLMEANAAELDCIDATDMGKPVSLTVFNAVGAAGFVRFCAEAVDKCSGETLATGPGSYSAVSFVPRGVVAAIVPWNFPTFNAVLKLGPGLAAGNSVVLKPSELSSRSAVRIAQLALEAGLPQGVLNVVVGQGGTIGRALAEHMGVDMIAFTGSTSVGKLMLQYSATSNMKVVLAECGGKSPQIVFDDCHSLDDAAFMIAFSITMNQGQVCSTGSRLLVQSSIAEDLIERVVQRMKALKPGNAIESTTTYGPLVTAKQMERVLAYIDKGTSEGATIVTGGHQFLKESGGYFVEPTLFKGVRPNSTIAQEEIFGPVLSATTFDTVEEAILLANSTKYGLAAYVWTTDVTKTLKMARYLKSGLVASFAAMPSDAGPGSALSIEAHGQSGIGIESGIPGIRSYMRQQLLWANY